MLNVRAHTFHSPDFESVVEQAVEFLVGTPEQELSLPHFSGAGVYTLYYLGGFELYRDDAELNKQGCEYPIYVGKAVPPGWRTARASEEQNTSALLNRLREHGRSISEGEGLRVQDFRCKFVIFVGVEVELISAVESQLIRDYKPLWNSVVDGFGNHDPGSGRYNQARSAWDVIHPGRRWAERLTGSAPSRDEIVRKIQAASESRQREQGSSLS